MAANVEWMFSGSRKVPWHGIGEVVDDSLAQEDALRASRLNYGIELWPVAAVSPRTGETLPLGPSNRATVRINADNSTQVLALVGGQYTPIQNKALFDLAESMLRVDEGVRYETAGILDEGRRVFILARLPDTITVSPEDKVKQYLALSNSHDGSMEGNAFLTNVRVVCANTLAQALGAARDIFRIRHTSSVEERVEEAVRTLRLAYDYSKDFGKLAETLAGVPFNMPDMTELAVRLYPSESKQALNARTELGLVFGVENTRTPATANTAWAAWNAVGERADHKPSAQSADKRLSSLWWGSRAEVKRVALATISDMKGLGLGLDEVAAPAGVA